MAGELVARPEQEPGWCATRAEGSQSPRKGKELGHQRIVLSRSVMGGSKGKAPRRRARPGRPSSAEQDSEPGDRRPGPRKARQATPATEPDTDGDKETAGGRGKPIAEGIEGCRPGAGPPPEAREGRGSTRHRGHRATEGCAPGDRCGVRPGQEEGEQEQEDDDGGQSLPREEGRTSPRGRRKRRGHGPRAPARRSRGGDSSGADGGSSCPDSEAREAPEPWPTLEPGDTGSEGTTTGPEPALKPSEPQSSDEAQAGASGTGARGASEASGSGTHAGLGAAEGTASPAPDARQAAPRGKDATSCALEGRGAPVPGSPRRPRDSGSQPEAAAETAEASTAGAQRRHSGKVVGKVQAAADESQAGAREGEGSGDPGRGDLAPLAALVAPRRVCTRPPSGPSPQAAGPSSGGLKARFLRVVRALGLLRWLWWRLRQPPDKAQDLGREDPERDPGREGEDRDLRRAGGGRDLGSEGEGRDRPSGLRRRLALRLAGLVRFGGLPRGSSGGDLSPPQPRNRPVPDDPSDFEEPPPDPKFAVVLPRIHRTGRASGSRSSGEVSAGAPSEEGGEWPRAGAAGDSEGSAASGEGVTGSCRASLVSPTPPDETPLENGSNPEAEPETSEAATPGHWALASGPREDPGPDTDALLPRLTLETRLRRERSACGSPRGQWEPEDEAEAALERDLGRSLGPSLEAPPFPGAEGLSLEQGLEDAEDLARLR